MSDTADAPAFHTDSIRAWIEWHRDQIPARLVDVVAGRAASEGQRAMLLRLVEHYPAEASCTADIVLPICRALTGEVGAGMDLALACGLNWVGAHCLDDLQDGDLPPEWRDIPPADVTFASLALGLVIPPDILAGLPVGADVRRRLQESFRRSVLDLFAGQAADLDRTVRADAGERVDEIARTVGQREPFGWWMRMAAELAGAPEDVAEAYRRYGHHLGIVGSIRRDLAEVLLLRSDSDLRNGTQTLHLAVTMAQMAPDERAGFAALLDAARSDPDAREAVRKTLRRARHVASLQAFVATHVELAQAALAEAAPPEPLRTLLKRWCVENPV